MSELLVHLQSSVGGYPMWLVVGGAGIVLATLCMLLGKIMRGIGVLLFLAIAIGGIWYFWYRVAGHPVQAAPTSLHDPAYP